MHISLKILLLLVSPLLILVTAAYIQWGTIGRPMLATSLMMTSEMAAEPHDDIRRKSSPVIQGGLIVLQDYNGFEPKSSSSQHWGASAR
jgi:hypothetical protein